MRKHLLWLLPLAALVLWSLFQQWRRPASPGEAVAASLRKQGVPLHAGMAFLEYRPERVDRLTAGRLAVEVAGQRLWAEAGSHVSVEPADTHTSAEQQLSVTVRGGGLDRELQPGSDWPRETGPGEVGLRIIGHELVAAPKGHAVRMARHEERGTGNEERGLEHGAGVEGGAGPGWVVEVRGGGWGRGGEGAGGEDYRWTQRPGGWARGVLTGERARQAEEPLLQALLTTELGRGGAERELAAARQRLGDWPEERLLVKLLGVDAGVVERAVTRGEAAEGAILLTAAEPVGSVLYFRGADRTVYVFAVREDLAEIRGYRRCRAVCVDKEGRGVWQAVLELGRGVPAARVIELVWLSTDFTDYTD